MGGIDIEAQTSDARASSDVPPASPGLEIARGVIDPRLIDDALRLLHLDLLERGAGAQELGAWLWGAHWFPHLTYAPEITRVADALPARWQTGERCDPQILLQFPHTGPEPEVTFHRDEEPAWAGERRYRRIVGVALSPWRADNGGLVARVDDSAVAVELDPGDAVMMSPEVWHSGGINRTGSIRYGVYFRWLEENPPAITPAG
jgi:Phytanoyl-CoA dioxygenase (PhyH)